MNWSSISKILVEVWKIFRGETSLSFHHSPDFWSIPSNIPLSGRTSASLFPVLLLFSFPLWSYIKGGDDISLYIPMGSEFMFPKIYKILQLQFFSGRYPRVLPCSSLFLKHREKFGIRVQTWVRGIPLRVGGTQWKAISGANLLEGRTCAVSKLPKENPTSLPHVLLSF